MAARARAYAEATFDIDAITDRFETVLTGVGASGGTPRRATAPEATA